MRPHGPREQSVVDVVHGRERAVVKGSHRPETNSDNRTCFVLQACLRRQQYRRDPNEKARDQFGGQDADLERSRASSGSSPKQVLGGTLGDSPAAGCVPGPSGKADSKANRVLRSPKGQGQGPPCWLRPLAV